VPAAMYRPRGSIASDTTLPGTGYGEPGAGCMAPELRLTRSMVRRPLDWPTASSVAAAANVAVLAPGTGCVCPRLTLRTEPSAEENRTLKVVTEPLPLTAA